MNQDRIFRISSHTHPGWYKILENVEVSSKTPDYLNVTEDKIKLAITENGLDSNILSSPTCPACGRVIPEGLYPDWRGTNNICLSRWYTCNGCMDLANSSFYKLLELNPEEKNAFVINLLKG